MRRTAWLWIVTLPLAGQVSFERIKNADQEPGNWLTYSGNYSSHRHSRLAQINAGNVGRLKPAWVYQVHALQPFETTPLVVDGIMYISEPPSNITAIDTRTGRSLWHYARQTPKDPRLCCAEVNRGVALLDDTVFITTVDAHVIAVDAKSGVLRWDTTAVDYKAGYSMTAAPLVVKDKVIVGMAGGEFGVRGFIDAYEAKTGKLAWRFWTIPGPGEPGHDTWAGDSWKTGSATTWVTGSYDPERNVVYWGTGNPGPDWNGDVRAGDNLYSDSLVALDADSGKLKWHFQFTPHDVHDWDSVEIPVLADRQFQGKPRKLVLFANRNGFYYVLDRETGRFLAGKELSKQTWAKGLDDSGRPVLRSGAEPSVEGTKAYPNVPGATNWFSPSYDPVADVFFVPVREEGGIYYKGEAKYKEGAFFNAGGARNVPAEEPWGAIRALAPDTGAVKWEFRLHSPPNAGVLSTAGGLVFGGTNEGGVFALDAATGKSLWKFQTGAGIQSNPVSYLSAGKQHVAVAAGNAIFDFALE